MKKNNNLQEIKQQDFIRVINDTNKNNARDLATTGINYNKARFFKGENKFTFKSIIKQLNAYIENIENDIKNYQILTILEINYLWYDKTTRKKFKLFEIDKSGFQKLLTHNRDNNFEYISGDIYRYYKKTAILEDMKKDIDEFYILVAHKSDFVYRKLEHFTRVIKNDRFRIVREYNFTNYYINNNKYFSCDLDKIYIDKPMLQRYFKQNFINELKKIDKSGYFKIIRVQERCNRLQQLRAEKRKQQVYEYDEIPILKEIETLKDNILNHIKKLIENYFTPKNLDKILDATYEVRYCCNSFDRFIHKLNNRQQYYYTVNGIENDYNAIKNKMLNVLKIQLNN